MDPYELHIKPIWAFMDPWIIPVKGDDMVLYGHLPSRLNSVSVTFDRVSTSLDKINLKDSGNAL